MNKYVRMVIEVPTGIIKATINSIRKNVKINPKCAISPFAEITIERAAQANIAAKFRARSGSHIRVRKGAQLIIGSNTSVNHNCMIVCREKIEIGSDVQFSPNIMVYDHDHDFRAEGGVKDMKYKSSPIKIGNNVWIGANSVILRGSVIGDNAVIGAGCVVKGDVPAGAVLVQKRVSDIVNKIGGVLHLLKLVKKESVAYA